MFPIKDDNPQINTPYAVFTLIGLNILAWLVLQGAGSPQGLNASVCQYGFIPASVGDAIDAFGSPPVCGIDSGSGWSGIISSMFMHGSWMHIIGNLWFLWIFGDNVEDSMGSVRFIVFYLLCGLLAALAQMASDPDSTIPMVGASGAIGGVMGAYIVLYPRVKVHLLVFVTTLRVPAIAMLGYWIFVQVWGGFSSSGATGGTAFWAHVGGFVAGAALVLMFKDEQLLAQHPYRGWNKSNYPTGLQ